MRNRWWRFANHKFHLNWAQAIAFSVLCVAAATLGRIVFGQLTGTTLLFAFSFPAVLFAALFGGGVAGLSATVLSVIVVWWAFLGDPFAFEFLSAEETANVVVFTAASLVVVWLALMHRRLILEYEKKEKETALLVGEVQHRGNNILAVVEVLIRQTTEDKDKAMTLINRIRATVNTHNILDSSSARTLSLREILDEELVKSHGGRVVLSGPEVLLSAPLSRALRLIFHEMTTNALKHGALSGQSGKVAIHWTLDGKIATIMWTELDGPKTKEPTQFNFGSKLIIRTLKQLNAQFEPTFAETGYCYKMTIPIGDENSA